MAKLFIAEAGSREVIAATELMNEPSRAVSVIAAIEVRSAIRRREAGRDLTSANAKAAIAMMEQELTKLAQVQVSEDILARATLLIDRRRVDALDSIQLAKLCPWVSRLEPSFGLSLATGAW